MAQLPLLERKELLDSILQPTESVAKVRWMYGNGESYFDLVKQGMVLKRADSAYQINKRSYDWLKVINYQYTEAFVTGIRKDEFGLLLALEQDGKLKPGGILEFMSPAAKKKFYQEYTDLIVDEDKKFVFLDPQIKFRVKFRNYTKAGMLKIPSFVEYIS